MEFMEGGDLFDIIEEYGPLEERCAAFLVFELLHGIESCQKNNVVHRDVKLANLALASKKGIERLTQLQKQKNYEDTELMKFRSVSSAFMAYKLCLVIVSFDFVPLS